MLNPSLIFWTDTVGRYNLFFFLNVRQVQPDQIDLLFPISGAPTNWECLIQGQHSYVDLYNYNSVSRTHVRGLIRYDEI